MNRWAEAYFKLAIKQLKASHVLYEQELLSQSISSSYYVMFYLAKAILLEAEPDRKLSKHSSVLGAFGKDFGSQSGQLGMLHHNLVNAQDSRVGADYDPFWIGETEEHAQLRLTHAQEFLAFAEQYFSPAEKGD